MHTSNSRVFEVTVGVAVRGRADWRTAKREITVPVAYRNSTEHSHTASVGVDVPGSWLGPPFCIFHFPITIEPTLRGPPPSLLALARPLPRLRAREGIFSDWVVVEHGVDNDSGDGDEEPDREGDFCEFLVFGPTLFEGVQEDSNGKDWDEDGEDDVGPED